MNEQDQPSSGPVSDSAAPEQVRPGDGPSSATGTGAEQQATTAADRVDEAISRLTELDDTPVHEHATVVEAIHRALQDTLAEDEG